MDGGKPTPEICPKGRGERPASGHGQARPARSRQTASPSFSARSRHAGQSMVSRWAATRPRMSCSSCGRPASAFITSKFSIATVATKNTPPLPDTVSRKTTSSATTAAPTPVTKLANSHFDATVRQELQCRQGSGLQTRIRPRTGIIDRHRLRLTCLCLRPAPGNRPAGFNGAATMPLGDARSGWCRPASWRGPKPRRLRTVTSCPAAIPPRS